MGWNYSAARNSPEEIDRLCRQWELGAYKAMQDWLRRVPPELVHLAGGIEEFESAARQALFNCARLFEPGRVGKSGKPCNSMGTVLYLAVKNQCQAHLNKTVHGQSVVAAPVSFHDDFEAGAEDTAGFHVSPLAPEADPDRPGSDELAAALASAEKVLPLSEWFVVRETVLRGRTHEEVGRQIGMTRERVKQVRHSGLRRLRRHFGVPEPAPAPPALKGQALEVLAALGRRRLTGRDLAGMLGMDAAGTKGLPLWKTLTRLVRAGVVEVVNPGRRPAIYRRVWKERAGA